MACDGDGARYQVCADCLKNCCIQNCGTHAGC
jgi:hypothetical protein